MEDHHFGYIKKYIFNFFNFKIKRKTHNKQLSEKKDLFKLVNGGTNLIMC
jgi:hypothetical protein